jgi:DNA-binding PadR family transcriptional regulator
MAYGNNESRSRVTGSSSMATVRKLSELEGCVLGLVKAAGPCTPYAIRQTFLQSPSAYWSGSAGAIYPLVARLEKRGLIRSQAHREGRRRSRRYSITGAGMRALFKWLGPPFPDWVVGIPADPLRTRLGFFEALPHKQQIEFLKHAEEQVRAQISEVEEDCAQRRANDDVYQYLVARGALRALVARLEWIREIASELDGAL